MNDLINSNMISEIKELLILARERVAVSVNT